MSSSSDGSLSEEDVESDYAPSRSSPREPPHPQAQQPVTIDTMQKRLRSLRSRLREIYGGSSKKKMPLTNEPSRPTSLTLSDQLLNEMRVLAEERATELRNMKKIWRHASIAASKYEATKETRQRKAYEEEERKIKSQLRSVAGDVRNFWRVIETVVLRRVKEGHRTRMADTKKRKQLELVDKAAYFAECLRQDEFVEEVEVLREEERKKDIERRD
eukprot:Trichotokara_eunicae@DN1054_c0_g1_i1.p1